MTVFRGAGVRGHLSSTRAPGRELLASSRQDTTQTRVGDVDRGPDQRRPTSAKPKLWATDAAYGRSALRRAAVDDASVGREDGSADATAPRACFGTRDTCTTFAPTGHLMVPDFQNFFRPH